MDMKMEWLVVLLANEETGSHIHYDDANSLENGSAELIIERIQ